MTAPFLTMQAAVDIVNSSEHDKNKISACLFSNQGIVATRVNHRPPALQHIFTPDIKIGDSSQFIHAEVACIFESTIPTKGSSLCVTDPFCPNCAKAICEGGIGHVYIDHKGMEKDFARRRGGDFEAMSLRMMERAGIPVTIVYRKEERLEPLRTAAHFEGDYHGIEILNETELSIDNLVADLAKTRTERSWAIARLENNKILFVAECDTPGMTKQDIQEYQSEKYRFTVDPVNRLMFTIQREGYHLAEPVIGCNLFPSSRDLVNCIDFGIEKIIVGSRTDDHHSHGFEAAELLLAHNVLDILLLK